MSSPRTAGMLLFPDFELLDVFGPLEALGGLPDAYRVLLIAATAGAVASAQGPRGVADHGFADCPPLDLLLVPGGRGTRREVDDEPLVAWLRARGGTTALVASVCTGAALLARAGLLDGRRATSNKRAFDWVVSQGPKVEWVRRARWIEDGRFWTSSGVSAGIDMTLAIVARQCGEDTAADAARRMEYVWQRDPTCDPFAGPDVS